jgi:hypothetical protein
MSAKQNDSLAGKPARLTILIDAEKKKAFEQLCAAQDITASQVVRKLIRDYLARHGVSWQRGQDTVAD